MGQVATSSVIVERGLRAEFIRTLESTAPHPLQDLATFVRSTMLEEKYGSLGDVPEMVEFADTKIAKGLLDRQYTLKNKRYEATIKLDKDAVRLDQTGDAKIKVAEMTQRGRLYPGALISAAMVAGTTDLCYDGTAFFGNSHAAEGASGTGDNLLAGSGATSANIITDLRTGRATMRTFKDTEGVPINDGAPMELVAVIPAELEGVFEEVQKALVISQTTNVMAGSFRYIVNARLTDANDWYLFNVAGTLKPFILQENDPLKFGALMDDSDMGFLTRYHAFGVEWMGRVGYGWWQKALKFANT